MRTRENVRRLALVLGVAACVAAPAAVAKDADPLVVSPAELRQAAILSLKAGDDARALAYADALLERDSSDVTALVIRARILRARGELAQAQSAARMAWRHGANDTEKYTAALLMAQALSSDGKRTRAQLWLRRAAQVAPTPGHAAKAAQDFKYVQRRNPWQTNLSFTLAPNSNINNGSSRDSSALLYRLFDPFGEGGTVEIPLGAASKALSGLEMGADVQSRYRFAQTERTAHDLRFGLSYRSYTLSNSARDALAAEDAERVARGEEPQEISGSDYAYGSVQLGYGFRQLRADRRGEFSLTADLGQTFFGGARYNSFGRLSLGQSYALSQQTKLNFGLRAETRNAQRGFDQSLLSLSGGMSRQLASGDGLYLGTSVTALRAEAERLEYDEFALRAGYVLGREVMGTALQFGLSTSFRDYDVSPHDASGRREVEISADVTATFRNIDYYGFNPTVSLSASTTNSNIGLYDMNRMGLSIGIASKF